MKIKSSKKNDMNHMKHENSMESSNMKHMSHMEHETSMGSSKMDHMSHMDHGSSMMSPKMAAEMEKDIKRRFFVAFFLTIPIMLYSHLGKMLNISLPSPIPIKWLLFILTTPVVFWSGSIFIKGAYYSLKSKKLNMSVLIATGVLAAYIFSILAMFLNIETFFEAAAMLVTFVLFGHWMEMKSRKGTSESLKSLFNLIPPQATIIKDGKEEKILSSDLKINDTVLIKPGDKIPIDGIIIQGEGYIDESMITGESTNVYKNVKDQLIGGSINKTGFIQYCVTKTGEETVLAQIINLVEKAQASKAPGQRIADKAAAYLVIIAIGSGILAFLGWFIIAQASFVTSLTFAISAVVVACPDALGLATPTAVAVGTGLAADNNILIKDAITLENTSKLNAIILDKTGTLTEGKAVITDIIPINSTKKELLYFGGSAQEVAKHPIGEALSKVLEEEKIQISPDVEKYEAISGLGVKANIDKQATIIGSIEFLIKNNIDVDSVKDQTNKLLQEGKSISLVAKNSKIIGIIASSDAIKKTAKKTVEELQKLGIEVVMVTGDHKIIAENVAHQLNISRFFAQVFPAEKANFVKKLQEEGKFVAMVGDGINDAPALAQADIGIAIGAGTDVAIETADIVLMKSDPLDILKAIKLSKAVVRKMKENLIWATCYNIIAIPIAAGVFYKSFGIYLRPEISALLMSLSSIIVATNAVLLKRLKLN